MTISKAELLWNWKASFLNALLSGYQKQKLLSVELWVSSWEAAEWSVGDLFCLGYNKFSNWAALWLSTKPELKMYNFLF